MKLTTSILPSLVQIVTTHMVRWVFWRALIRIWLLLMALFVALEVPALIRSTANDQRRALEVIEGRKRFSGQTLARMVDLGNRILNAANPLESATLIGLISGGNPSFPGIVSLGTLRRPSDSLGWMVEQESARHPDFLMSRMMSHEEVSPLIERSRQTGKPCMSRIFRSAGSSGGPERTLISVVYPMIQPTGTWRTRDPRVLALLVDLDDWIRVNGVPEPLKVLRFYLANEPNDGIIVSLNGSASSEQPFGPAYLPLELGNPPKDPLRDLATLEAEALPLRPTGEIPPRPSKDARTRLISFDGFESPTLRIYVDIPNEFLRTRELVLKNIPLRLALVTIISVLLALMWVLFSEGNQQMRRLAEAQQTITRLNLHRTMIQQELHDHIIQNLTMLGIQVAAATPKDQAGFQATRAAVLKQLDYLRGELRRLLMDGTQRLESFDEMVSQVRTICRHLESQSTARCGLTASNPDHCTLNSEVLFRSCRFVEELVSNAIRHGSAKQIEIVLATDSARSVLRIEVSDDGNGFDPENYRPGFGLQSMAAFARRSRGTLQLRRREPRGMSIELVVPFGPGSTPPAFLNPTP